MLLQCCANAVLVLCYCSAVLVLCYVLLCYYYCCAGAVLAPCWSCTGPVLLFCTSRALHFSDFPQSSVHARSHMLLCCKINRTSCLIFRYPLLHLYQVFIFISFYFCWTAVRSSTKGLVDTRLRSTFFARLSSAGRCTGHKGEGGRGAQSERQR